MTPAPSGRWEAYGDLLSTALRHGYAVVGLDEWVREPPPSGERCLILRHDVDQQPASAVRMAGIESELGVQATWYFRWRTAHPRVVEQVAAHGAAVGLHYETLTRAVLARGGGAPDDALVLACRNTLRREITAFRARFGPVRSVCPHGDTRVPGVDNHVLLRGQDPADFGVVFDGNEVLRGRPLGAWITDRRGGDTWKDGADPRALLEAGTTPLFAVVHPNNWTTRLHAAADRALRAALPDVSRIARPVRSTSDEPPL